jgi:hypothetical protein
MRAKTCGSAVIIAASLSAALAGSAMACGDKLVALGGGVGFERVMVSRHPGNIIMLLEPATGLTAANERFNLAASLSLAGHEVTIIRTAEELRTHRDGSAPDLILVDAARARLLEFQPVSSGTAPVILPVVYSAGPEEVATAEQETACVTVAGGRKGAQLLQAVEKAMKLRSRGLPMPCEKSPDSQQA